MLDNLVWHQLDKVSLHVRATADALDHMVRNHHDRLTHLVLVNDIGSYILDGPRASSRVDRPRYRGQVSITEKTRLRYLGSVYAEGVMR